MKNQLSVSSIGINPSGDDELTIGPVNEAISKHISIK
jgi:hypothetical protein